MPTIPFRRLLLGLILASSTVVVGCQAEIQVPPTDSATAEANRQKYETMARQERLNQ